MKDSSVGDQKQLLLIDDDPNLILLVKDYLEFRGYQVKTAGNGREALDILADDDARYDYLRRHDARNGWSHLC
jgi:CheY-like chemotaxis protein